MASGGWKRVEEVRSCSFASHTSKEAGKSCCRRAVASKRTAGMSYLCARRAAAARSAKWSGRVRFR